MCVVSVVASHEQLLFCTTYWGETASAIKKCMCNFVILS